MRLSFFAIIFGSILFSGQSFGFSEFENNLDQIKNDSSLSINNKHLVLFQHTLNLGVYGLDYLKTSESANGLFLRLVKESWQEYVRASIRMLAASKERSEAQRALTELYLIERTQTLYDTYIGSKPTRLILKDQSVALDHQIDRFLKSTLSKPNKVKIPSLLEVVSKQKPSGYDQSIIFRKYANDETIEDFATLTRHYSDLFTKLFTLSRRSISYSFGLVAGPIEWGGGQLGNDVHAHNKIRDQLKPLDIIFEKKGYKLTDYVIPGYWGHNAIWLGTKAQLVELGIWDSDELAPFRAHIEAGNSIFEMRKQGITFSSFHEWMDLDDFAAIRVEDILEKPEKDILKIFKMFSEQDGKIYDFGFNANITSRITCSELIYLAYGDYKWPTKQILGRTTIRPDDLAEAVFYQNAPFEFVSFVTGDVDKGATFQSKKAFADLLGFSAQKDGTFKKRYKVCNLNNKPNHQEVTSPGPSCVKKEKYLYLT